jgi:hypothetical protein
VPDFVDPLFVDPLCAAQVFVGGIGGASSSYQGGEQR